MLSQNFQVPVRSRAQLLARQDQVQREQKRQHDHTGWFTDFFFADIACTMVITPEDE